MKVIEHIKQNGLESLSSLGIIVKKYPEGLIVLNYSQIESPKHDAITMECRGLIIDEQYNVVSRSFDRFFNYGEMGSQFDINKSTIFEKLDGSLIKIYNWKDVWYVSTRGTAYAESSVNGFEITFKGLVFKSLNIETDEQFQRHCNSFLDKNITYICEITAMENRVVTRYAGYTLWFLAARNNITFKYEEISETTLLRFGCVLPEKFTFKTVTECVMASVHLPDLKEGYVAYESGVPVCKIKSPAYVATHHLRGDGLNPKRIAELVVINEQAEYLKYFPEDTDHFAPYIDALASSLQQAQHVYTANSHLTDQKQFALSIKGHPFCHLLFEARKRNNNNIKHVFDCGTTEQKVKFLLSILNVKES